MDILTEWAMRVPHGIVRDLERYAIATLIVWFVLWVALRSVLHFRKIREDSPARSQMLMEFLHSLRSIAIFSVMGSLIWLVYRLDLAPWEEVNERLTGPYWFWGSIAAMIVAHDAYYYWTHRWMHQPRNFRLWHRRHHRSNNPSPFTAYSFDIREAALMVSFILGWELIVPNPHGSTGMYVMILLFKNTLLHSGYELMPRWRGKPLLDWMTTTVHHDLHHKRAGTNFGLYFTWWDRWGGTEDPTYHAEFDRVTSQWGRKKLPLAPAAPLV
ncbi:sterol desaturase family protein [Parvularcula maris]|uniref:Sterol desaturase family protein n=1 Tax=Parvularcula maris TaxID=2965077 RepID=A0A9X2L8B4_9PROT|nr:sterol desaturase family protein [Parvularcula maris]MCQ8184794.1 sterol desaturase family protein [Parvularcula maris]